MFAAAGIVVTEISTPISAPDLAVERLSIPAAPAQAATMNANPSGLEMICDESVVAAVEVLRDQARRVEAPRGHDRDPDREREADEQRGGRAARELSA